MLWKRVAANAGKALKWCRFSAENRCQFASERPDMTVLAKETTARLAASFEVRIFPHGGASASVSIMKRTDGPKQFSKLHIFTQINPLCREIFFCCGKINYCCPAKNLENVVWFCYQANCIEIKVRRLTRKIHYRVNAHGVCRRYTSMRNPLQAAERRSCGYSCMRK